jgi:hypothetical protein
MKVESDHLSASQINLWIDDPALWILKYVDGNKEYGRMPAAWRGNAVEKAVDMMLEDGNFNRDELLGTVLQYFQTLGGLPEDKEYANLEGYLDAAIDFIKRSNWGKPVSCQKKVEHEIEGENIQMYFDYEYEGLIRDCKTTGRMPNGLGQADKWKVGDPPLVLSGKDDHIRQMALYREGGGFGSNTTTELFYITPKKVAVYQPSVAELDLALNHSKAAIRAMSEYEERDFWRYVPRDMSGFRWDDNLRAAAIEKWSL